MDRRIESPCRQVCRLGSDRICDGCGRTIDEIVQWLSFSDADRQAVIDRVANWSTRGPR